MFGLRIFDKNSVQPNRHKRYKLLFLEQIFSRHVWHFG